MLSTAAASCCLLLSSTSTLALASLSAPAAAAATCSPPTGAALLRHVSNHFKARWCGVQRQAAAATRGGSAFTVGGAGRRHCGAPMLRRYATTSALLRSMAHLSAVLPPLQRRE